MRLDEQNFDPEYVEAVAKQREMKKSFIDRIKPETLEDIMKRLERLETEEPEDWED